MTTTCSACGAVSEADGVFREERRSFRLKKAYYCPSCWTSRKKESVPAALLWVLALSMLGGLLLSGSYWPLVFKAYSKWILLSVCVPLVYLPLLILHELGHAVCARLLGWRVFSITLGNGRALGTFRLGGPPAFQGTRGSILIERGDVSQGLPMVHKAFDGNEDPRLKALNACYIAIGEFKLGNREEGEKARDLARRLDSDCLLLEKVDRVFSG